MDVRSLIIVVHFGSIVLAGGVGKRLGQRKQKVELGQKNLLQYVLDASAQLSNEIVVVNAIEDDSTPILSSGDLNIITTTDLREGVGPMMGILSGMKKLSTDYSVVLPCDSPFISVPLMRALIEKAENYDAVIPIWPNGNVEPLHSVYRLSSSIPAIESAFEVDERSVLDMIKRLDKVRYVSIDELRRFDKELLTFFNINFPNDLETAKEILSMKSAI